MEETQTVGQATGVPVPGDHAGEDDEVLPGLRPARSEARSTTTSPPGRRLEIETLNGTVVRLGQERGVPTPANFAVYAALKPYADGAPPA